MFGVGCFRQLNDALPDRLPKQDDASSLSPHLCRNAVHVTLNSEHDKRAVTCSCWRTWAGGFLLGLGTGVRFR